MTKEADSRFIKLAELLHSKSNICFTRHLSIEDKETAIQAIRIALDIGYKCTVSLAKQHPRFVGKVNLLLEKEIN